MPVLTGWASRYASLREVTRQDILDAVDARHGPVIQHRIIALRSLFRALRQERVIFRDPTRGISLPAPARLAVALVAIHAVTVADLIHLQATGLDLATGTLTIRRGYRHRIVYLDEVTAINYVHAAHPGRQSVIPR
jgi:site-specific recombinase XerD